MIILLNYFSNLSENHPNCSTNKNGQIKGFGRTAINLWTWLIMVMVFWKTARSATLEMDLPSRKSSDYLLGTKVAKR